MTEALAGPDRLEALLLQAGLWETSRARRAWDEFCARVDDVEALSGSCYNLFSLVAVNLESTTPDLPHGNYLRSVLKHSWARSKRFLSLILPILQMLRDEHIDFIIFKGVALTALYYQHWGARPEMNLGLLVQAQDAESAIRLLLRNGYIPPPNFPAENRKDFIRFGHALAWTHPDKGDLHLYWHLVQPGSREPMKENPWARTMPCPLPGFETKALGATDLFLQTCLEETAPNPASVFSRLADAAMILRHGNLDWAELEAQARYFQRIHPVRELILQLDRLDLGVPKLRAEQWRQIQAGALETMEEACRLPGHVPRRRIKSFALAYLRFSQGATPYALWQNLGAYLRQLPDLKGLARRVAMIWYIARWNRFRAAHK